MWNQACNELAGVRHKAAMSKTASLQILPCTVSQLLSASNVRKNTFAICDWEFNQVSIVGVIRGSCPFASNIEYTLDDMTAPPLVVQQWLIREDCKAKFPSPGTYVKVTGTLQSRSSQRLLVSMNIRCVKDLNEITSHMLEVVQAHMQLFRKVFDVNMNTTLASLSGSCAGGHPKSTLPNGLSTTQAQVLHVVRKFSVRAEGIGLHDLEMQLNNLHTRDLRSSLDFLINEGHVFFTIDEHHFKSTEY